MKIRLCARAATRSEARSVNLLWAGGREREIAGSTLAGGTHSASCAFSQPLSAATHCGAASS